MIVPWIANLRVPSWGPEGHHPLGACSTGDGFAVSLHEDGGISCPHGDAGEDDASWRAKRNELACQLIMECLTHYDRYGWPQDARAAA